MDIYRKPSNPMTKQRAAIAKYLVQVRGLTQHQTAAILELNQGRVSEVLSGKVHPEVPPAENFDPAELGV